MGYVIYRIRDGKYVFMRACTTVQGEIWTTNLAEAKRYKDRQCALMDHCVENEFVAPLEAFLAPLE